MILNVLGMRKHKVLRSQLCYKMNRPDAPVEKYEKKKGLTSFPDYFS